MEQQRAEDSQGRDAAAAPTPVAPSGSGEADAAAAAAPSLTTEDDQAAAKAKAAAARERGGAAFRRGEFKAAAEAYYEAAKHEPLVHTHFSNLALALLKLEARYGEIWGDMGRYIALLKLEATRHPVPHPRPRHRHHTSDRAASPLPPAAPSSAASVSATAPTAAPASSAVAASSTASPPTASATAAVSTISRPPRAATQPPIPGPAALEPRPLPTRPQEPAHAVTAAKRCTELAPSFAKGWFRLGAAQRAKGNLSAACDAFAAGLPHASPDEARDLRRQLAEARKALDCVPAGIEEVSPLPSPASSAPEAGKPAPWAAGGDKARGKVDLAKAVQTAKRVAELAPATQAGPDELLSLGYSAFERSFLQLWARGKASSQRDTDLAAYLGQLPRDARGLAAFVGDAMSEETLSAFVLAAERVMLPRDAVAAAAFLGRLASVRRFELLWMFQGKAESTAATNVLRAAVATSGGDKPAREAATKYGVKL